MCKFTNSEKYIFTSSDMSNQLSCQNYEISVQFDYLTNFDDEYDIIFFHPNEKLILAGEVKQAMPNTKNPTAANDKQAESASHQLRVSERVIEKTFCHRMT